MTVQEVVQLVSSLGFPIALVIIFVVFFYRTVWPWFTSFMKGYVDVLVQNTAAMQTMTAAIAAVAEEIRSQPNSDLAKAMVTMGEQHLQLSQQLAAVKSELSRQLDVNLGYIKEIAPGVRPGQPKMRDARE